MTAQDLINGALRLVGVLAAGEDPSADMSNDALVSLNDMIDTWSNQSLLIFEDAYETLALTVGKQSYQWGVGASAPDFTTARPQKLQDVNWQQVTATTTLELPVEIINQDQWAAISVKNITSNIPTRCWLQNTFPYAVLYVWPIPAVAGNLVIWSWKPLTDLSALTTSLSLPPGYSRALRYNLALELAPEYGKTPSELVVAHAIESKANLKSMNSKILLMATDPAVLNRRSTWNWYTGE